MATITHNGEFILISKEDRDTNFPIPNSNGGVWNPVDCNEGAFVHNNEEVLNFLIDNEVPYSIVESVTVTTQEDVSLP